MPALNNLPDMDIWLVDGQYYLVTYVPGSEPPIPLLWSATEAEIKAALTTEDKTITPDRILSQSQMASAGALIVGDRAQIANTTEDPYLAWENAVTKQAAVRPWLNDPEVLALIAEGLWEGREVSLAEFQQTGWWQSHTEGERAWLSLLLADPLTAQQRLDNNKVVVRDQMSTAGIADAPEELIDLYATKLTTGVWTEAMLVSQIRALADPASGLDLDPDVTKLITDHGLTVDTTRSGEMDVADTVRQWLGPIHGQWTQSQIAEWAGRLRNDPDAAIEFRDMLSQQRMALFPGYTNPALTYEDIAGPWRTFASNMWGMQMDETDMLFPQLVNNNDAAKNAELLRRYGLKRGIGTVLNDFFDGIARNFSQIRRPI